MARERTDLTHIVIMELAPDRHRRWQVLNKHDAGLLGRIEWFGLWRKYVFTPFHGTVFEEVCMRELSDFIVERTKEYKAAKAASHPTPTSPAGEQGGGGM